MEAIYLGIDVSKQWLDVGIWPGSESFRVGNDATGIAQLVAQLRALNLGAVVLESSGGLEALSSITCRRRTSAFLNLRSRDAALRTPNVRCHDRISCGCGPRGPDE